MHNRGQSTDVSSLPKSLVQSNSEHEPNEVKLTKELLAQFEAQTRTSPIALIDAYLDRCAA